MPNENAGGGSPEAQSRETPLDETRELPPVSLEDAIQQPESQAPFANMAVEKQKVENFVRKFQTTVAGFLGIILWLFLVGTGAWHVSTVGTIANRLLEKDNPTNEEVSDTNSTKPSNSNGPEQSPTNSSSTATSNSSSRNTASSDSETGNTNTSELDFEAYDKAASMVGDTAKTIYAVITPLATAVTGFYFVLQSDKNSKSDDDN